MANRNSQHPGKDIYHRDHEAKKIIDENRRQITGNELHNVHYTNADVPTKQSARGKPAA